MLRLVFRIALLALLSAVVASCGTRPRQTADLARMFDIRGTAVTANGGVPTAVIMGIDRQMELAVEGTVYAVPKPRGVLNIHIASVRREPGRAQAEISATLSDVESGQPVLVRNYLVLAFSERTRVSDATIVDAVAARLRVEFGLSMPPIRPVVRHDPALSTRLDTDLRQRDATVEPVVIPLRTAPVVGADQDPMLNSRTRVAPVDEPARIEPAVKVEEKTNEPVVIEKTPVKKGVIQQAPAENALESGARAKVVIKPQATQEAPADDEPCVETLDKKC